MWREDANNYGKIGTETFSLPRTLPYMMSTNTSPNPTPKNPNPRLLKPSIHCRCPTFHVYSPAILGANRSSITWTVICSKTANG